MHCTGYRLKDEPPQSKDATPHQADTVQRTTKGLYSCGDSKTLTVQMRIQVRPVTSIKN
jgi:hypothetical protein